ncbi:MAG TPA: hypothetical protein VII36_08575, partial [Usitatibacter sp.]
IGFLAAGFLAAGFFEAFLPFLDAIDESSNLMVTLSSVHLASIGATARGCARAKHLSTVFTLYKAFSPLTCRLRNTRFAAFIARAKRPRPRLRAIPMAREANFRPIVAADPAWVGGIA